MIRLWIILFFIFVSAASFAGGGGGGDRPTTTPKYFEGIIHDDGAKPEWISRLAMMELKRRLYCLSAPSACKVEATQRPEFAFTGSCGDVYESFEDSWRYCPKNANIMKYSRRRLYTCVCYTGEEI